MFQMGNMYLLRSPATQKETNPAGPWSKSRPRRWFTTMPCSRQPLLRPRVTAATAASGSSLVSPEKYSPSSRRCGEYRTSDCNAMQLRFRGVSVNIAQVIFTGGLLLASKRYPPPTNVLFFRNKPCMCRRSIMESTPYPFCNQTEAALYEKDIDETNLQTSCRC